jgi:catechol 2,3-dioxygenase-like lactoylglutathione lyase family enzyme
MDWTDSQRAELARQYTRVGYVQGELWPAPPDTLEPAAFLELLKSIPTGAGRDAYIAALKTGGKPVPKSEPVSFAANNELALHVPDPVAAEKFYTDVLGCTVFDRTPDCISLSNGPLNLYLLRDPKPQHDAVVPSFSVTNRTAALEQLKAAGCVLVPIGPHAPGEFYVKDPHGILFDVVERVT